jgi:Na+-translocating ferredoxin:NAD+ oxidoreductase RnfE subunit
VEGACPSNIRTVAQRNLIPHELRLPAYVRGFMACKSAVQLLACA